MAIGTNKIDYQNQRDKDLSEGKLFTWQVSIPLADATPKYFLARKSDITKIIKIDPLIPFGTSGTIRMNFYAGHDYSGGTARTDTYNRNGNPLQPATFKIYEDPIDQGGGKGVNFSQIDVGTQSTNQTSGGGSAQSSERSIYNDNLPFLIELINNSGESCFLNIVLGWKEE